LNACSKIPEKKELRNGKGKTNLIIDIGLLVEKIKKEVNGNGF
jgi:hypothetical protein